jgi:hypothetical protein
MSPDLEKVTAWVGGCLHIGNVTLIVDIVAFAKEQKLKVKRKEIVERVQLNHTFLFNLEQKRLNSHSNKYRAIIALGLSSFHTDIGFFAKSKNYSTLVTYQSSYLVARDMLSKYTYVIILRGNR